MAIGKARKLMAMLLAAGAVLGAWADGTHNMVQLWEGGPYWAETNIGAENPWDSGYYFWWGDTVGYYRENDKWVANDDSSSNFSFLPENTPTYYKIVSKLLSEGWIVSKDGTNVLVPEHDAAHVQWGGSWCMPTEQEFDDLKNNCDWTWTTTNGVNGYVVRGRGDYASASIFLPCAGCGYGTLLNDAGSEGYYWASVPYSDSDSYGAYGWYFDSGYSYMRYYYRYYGRSVRPVNNAPPEVVAAIAAIAAIGKVAYTDESKAKIDAARTAYDALTDEQKALVTNYATLTAAEAAYAALAPKPVEPAAAPCYAVLNEGDITAPYAAEKSVTLKGAAYDGCDVVGIVELKLGKVNAKKGTSKVSGSVTTLDGKAHKMKAVNITDIDGTTAKAVSLDVKDLGTLAVTIGGTQFAGVLGGKYHVQSAAVGGTWAGGSAIAAVEIGDLSAFPGTVLADFLPTHEVAVASGTKWSFAKAASVKWAKLKSGTPLPEIYDEPSGKGLVVDTSKGTNLSGIKLTYTPKKGTFKGSFNAYALEGAGAATKLKKYKINASGVVVGGVGYGTATSKKPAISWPLTVK